MDVSGKEEVKGAFHEVADAGKELGEALMEHTKQLAEVFFGYEAVVKVMETFKEALEIGGKVADLSEQTGISAGKLIILQRAFENNGLAADDLGKLVNKMQKFIEGAGDEGSKTAEKLAKLNLTTEQLQDMTPDEQFEAIGKAIASISDPTERAALSMEIFGKSGGKTLALFHDFDNSIAESKAEVGTLAETMDKSAESFHQVEISFAEIGNKATEFAAGILSDALPSLKTLTEYLRNVDATAFGQQFSAAFSKGIDISLSIFRDPGNLFLAFGESLIYAFKQAINTLDSGIVYVFNFAQNYFSDLIPNASKLFEAEFTAAVGFVMSNLNKALSEVLTGIAGYLPEKFGKPLEDLGNKLRDLSEQDSDRYTSNLATAWDQISGSLAKATEETHYQQEDYMDAKGSAIIIAERLNHAAESGASFREEIAESVESAKAMAQFSEQIAKQGEKFMDSIVGGAKNFKDFVAGGGESGDLAIQSGISPYKAPTNVGPINTDTGGGKTTRSYARSTPSGPTLSDSEASNKTAADFSAYANSNQFGDGAYNALDISNRDTVISNLASAISRDANRSGDAISFADAKDIAIKQYDEQFNKNKGPLDSNGSIGVGSSSSGGRQASPEESILSKILDALTTNSGSFIGQLNNKLPQPVLS